MSTCEICGEERQLYYGVTLPCKCEIDNRLTRSWPGIAHITFNELEEFAGRLLGELGYKEMTDRQHLFVFRNRIAKVYHEMLDERKIVDPIKEMDYPKVQE